MTLKIHRQNELISFAGELNRDTLMSYSPFDMLNKCSGSVIFDMQDLTSVDTAGLAWLLQQLGVARQKNLVITLHNVPAQLLSLAEVSAVSNLLPISD